MNEIKKTEAEAACEVPEVEGLTMEELLADNEDLQKQNHLLVQQITRLEKRYADEKEKWRQYKADVLEENDVLRRNVQKQERMLNHLFTSRNKETAHKIVSIPKFVFAALAAMAVMAVALALQKACVIGPSVGYGVQCSMAMIIAWCYAIIVERSRK